ncbi:MULTISPECIES: hypothetical protein [Chryseobacterium group]|uniref:hypothetical protein n=1 Tax=Chryseobacterium group TaxID=2782232 RepID=UPI001C482091|nr:MULTISPECIES: hypothetical protein [Chryseobacterium]MCP2039309.1 hypothetical protein [Chryseobacterium sp. HSC-36S06]UFK98375.1 hypothetical protein LL667_03215 [Chryseobacterium faecale]
MKNLFNISLVLFAAFILFSCRNNDEIPEDIHEHEDIEKLVVTATNKNNASDVQTVNYIGGVADKHLHLEVGATYAVKLDFQVKHDDHYHSANNDIIKEKDEHFITFQFSDSDVTVQRTSDDVVRTDGNKVGLSTEWKINSVSATGKANIKLVHTPTSVNQNYPSAENQQGQTSGGETDVNALVDLH